MNGFHRQQYDSLGSEEVLLLKLPFEFVVLITFRNLRMDLLLALSGVEIPQKFAFFILKYKQIYETLVY
jgi:hypothetical protein